MPSIGSVFRHITGKHARPPTEAEMIDAAIAAHPPVQRAADDAEYRGLFVRLAMKSLDAHRERKPLPLPLTQCERLVVAGELGQIVASVSHYLQARLDLRREPHLQIGMHPSEQEDTIDISVSC